MRILTTINAMQRFSRQARKKGETIGFVPTMGFLHDGHAALLRRCRRENDRVVLSIFVNPLQFGPTEDYCRYPRNKKHDERLAKKEKVDIIFYPSVKEMYPTGYLTKVSVAELTRGLCGRSRPGHFDGVATVVAKLVNAVMPDAMYLGQKDAQQVRVLAQMVRDLNWPVMVKVVSTVRESDGLALSSRNSYLTPQERQRALCLFKALSRAKRLVQGGERSSLAITSAMTRTIQRDAGKIDYIACVDANTLRPVRALKGKVLIALAVYIGKTRLIDNAIVSV